MNCSNSAWARDRGDPIHTAVSAVHRYQIQARCQRDPSVSQFALAEVTRHYYGHHSVREFLGVCYVTLWMCFLRRQWPRARPGRARSPWDIVSRPGESSLRPGTRR